MTPHYLTDHAIRTACDGDNMLHDRQSHPANRSRAWTTLTRTDARVALDQHVTLDPLPTEKFDIWQAVGAKEAAA